MSLTFPLFMGRKQSDAGATAHVNRVAKLPLGLKMLDDHYFLTIEEDIDTLIARAQSGVVEAHFVDRLPSSQMTPEDELDIAAQERLAQDDAQRFLKARRWAQEAIDSGWYEASGGG